MIGIHLPGRPQHIMVGVGRGARVAGPKLVICLGLAPFVGLTLEPVYVASVVCVAFALCGPAIIEDGLSHVARLKVLPTWRGLIGGGNSSHKHKTMALMGPMRCRHFWLLLLSIHPPLFCLLLFRRFLLLLELLLHLLRQL